ncbi:uncharacterized protein PG986_004255 [Apiospora aurea]|uniref:Uncharacterized protein n=1 Tax=Apiospora aurea TaxID=335848 RepID=A0ABR1QM23_9PEZI
MDWHDSSITNPPPKPNPTVDHPSEPRGEVDDLDDPYDVVFPQFPLPTASQMIGGRVQRPGGLLVIGEDGPTAGTVAISKGLGAAGRGSLLPAFANTTTTISTLHKSPSPTMTGLAASFLLSCYKSPADPQKAYRYAGSCWAAGDGGSPFDECTHNLFAVADRSNIEDHFIISLAKDAVHVLVVCASGHARREAQK